MFDPVYEVHCGACGWHMAVRKKRADVAWCHNPHCPQRGLSVLLPRTISADRLWLAVRRLWMQEEDGERST